MSNKAQLQTNNTTLDALITRVNAAKDVAASLPDAGEGSGGNIETCTVQITFQGGYLSECAYVEFDSNISTLKVLHTNIVDDEYNIVLHNVVCGSFIYLAVANLSIIGNTLNGGVEFCSLGKIPHNRYYKAPSIPNSTGEIIIYHND